MSEMTCVQFEEIVHGLVRLEVLDIALRDTAIDHAGACARCAELLADVQAWAEISDADAESALVEETPAYVEAALVKAFRERHQQRNVWKQSLQWVAAAALAAGLALAAWGIYSKWSGDIFKRHTPITSTAQQTGSSSPQAALLAASANAQPADADSLANFVPLPDADTSDADDPGVVVHVALTRGSLGELGYPVDKAHATEIVQADVLVGEDGWPRAVRLVQ